MQSHLHRPEIQNFVSPFRDSEQVVSVAAFPELERTMEEADTTAFLRLGETGELETQEGRGDTRRNTGGKYSR
ncbi:hypothetical protein G5714_008862 [Onychostoma macrolepis]|uniref:Uncharacterized protein n=1 Tax=Onychostoma macrolepis TaxID=369639 RepID=A0A7J6CQU0_9TELE|nr:hypothetical protein G5714_008862 [Onychostoma macrolepis]